MPKLNLQEFASKKREQAIINIENSSALGVILKWAMTHWVTIAIVCVFGFLSIRNYIIQQDLYDQLLQKEIQDLEADKKKMEEDRLKLQAKVKQLELSKVTSKKETALVRESLKNKTLEQKKIILLEYKNRLLKKRGIN